MDFSLNDEQLEFKALCRRFASEVIRPAAPIHDADESVPWEVMKEARRWGLHGVEHIQRLGADPDGQFSAIYAEELHWGCAGIALALSASTLGRGPGRPAAPRSRSPDGFRSASGWAMR